MRLASGIVLVALAVAAVVADRSIVFAQRLEFEVASVKPNVTNGRNDFNPRVSGGLVTMHNVQLFRVFYYAYNLSGNYQVVGYDPLPDGWNWYDIEARTNADATDEQVRLMFQALLEDRFKLKVHRETRNITGYELTIGKGKPRITPAREGAMTVTIEGRSFTQRADACASTLWKEGNHFVCHSAAMDRIAATLSGMLQAPIVDRTGLTGTYDLNLFYVTDGRTLQADAPLGATLEQAVQEELGLKLEKGNVSAEVIVVDHLEKPSEN